MKIIVWCQSLKCSMVSTHWNPCHQSVSALEMKNTVFLPAAVHSLIHSSIALFCVFRVCSLAHTPQRRFQVLPTPGLLPSAGWADAFAGWGWKAGPPPASCTPSTDSPAPNYAVSCCCSGGREPCFASRRASFYSGTSFSSLTCSFCGFLSMLFYFKTHIWVTAIKIIWGEKIPLFPFRSSCNHICFCHSQPGYLNEFSSPILSPPSLILSAL